MTKPQIWTAAFLLLFIILFVLGRITNEDSFLRRSPEMNMTPPSDDEMQTKNLSGEEMFNTFGCVNCHGVDLNGTAKGPKLQNISSNFSRDKLIAYLRNPSSFMNTERFQKYRKQYPQMMMPGFGNKNIKDLGKLADFLLTK